MNRISIVFVFCVLIAACAGTNPPQNPSASQLSNEIYWPTQDWRSSSPEEQGMDGGKLDELLDSIPRKGLDLDSLLIIRHGTIVSETYFHGFNRDEVQQQWSCTKSFIATLLGIAIDQGLITDTSLTVTDFAPDYAMTLDAEKRQISLEHMLTMTTGLDWKENGSSIGDLYRSEEWAAFMYDLPMVAQPGEVFNYCSGCSHLLSAAIRSASGMNTQEFAEQTLFTPLGITDYTWETDPEGTPIGGWGLELTPRDMAKLGYLYLHAGEWEGKQVVSSAWIDRATQKLVEGDGELGYGYQWWIYHLFGAYTALGHEGQTIFVVPDEDLIVVTTATSLENHDAIFDMIENHILTAIQGP